eukprot:TRINITY_DN5779_c0_g1_i6.p2 TRINITY_DN5779_c0_g1~~TRINITY_DN5779_c0_g1_i6.p2  ORF type:complete len:162 (-),score=19.47 TRINITY_DN5779_c0_g1_i6:258-743(-)
MLASSLQVQMARNTNQSLSMETPLALRRTQRPHISGSGRVARMSFFWLWSKFLEDFSGWFAFLGGVAAAAWAMIQVGGYFQSLKSDITILKSSIDDVKSDLKSSIDDVKSDLKSSIDDVKSDLKSSIDDVKGKIDSLDKDVKELSGSVSELKGELRGLKRK